MLKFSKVNLIKNKLEKNEKDQVRILNMKVMEIIGVARRGAG